MASLPVLSGEEAVRVFKALGWGIVRQRGSHIIMTRDGELATLKTKGTVRFVFFVFFSLRSLCLCGER